MLEARDLKKVYSGQLCVLKGVSLTVRPAEILSIVGPSGAGKSTLLHILGGLDEPTSGNIFFQGESFSSMSEARRAEVRNKKFGFVFQFYHLLGEFNALENVMMPALVARAERKSSIIQDKAADLLKFLGLSDRFFHKPSQLSGGEQQRVAMARALMNDPEVLFCDEPTGNLDYKSGKQVYDMLLELNAKKKMAIIIVTHSSELAKNTNRILNIFDGKIDAVKTA